MDLSPILEAVHADGQAKIFEIQRQAQAQAEEILSEARSEAETLRRQARESAAQQISRKQASILHSAHMESHEILGRAIQGLTQEALHLVESRLVQLRSSAAYPNILRRLTNEALFELCASLEADSSPVLIADQRDQEIVETFRGIHFPETKNLYELDCWGGLIAQSEDGRIVVDNTLEARFDRAKPFLSIYLAAFFQLS